MGDAFGGSTGAGDGAGVVDASGAEAGARGLAGAGVDADWGEAGAEAGDLDADGGSGGALGGLPLLGLAATGVSSSTAAGWQFSQ